MEKICKHIENLLAQHDYVVVPNFGGFVIQTQNAIIHQNIISAPRDTIGFNPLMHHSDGLLAIEIAKYESISYRKAMELIENTVKNVNLKLKNNGEIQFGNLGSFKQNSLGNIQFIPNKLVDFLPQNFGLTDIRFSTRKTTKNAEKKNIAFTIPTQNIYKYAAAAMLIFGLLFVAPDVNDVQKQNNADFTTLINNNFKKKTFLAEPIDTILTDTTDLSTKDTIPTSASKQETQPKSKKEVMVAEKFHVIVASLPTKESAKEYFKRLKSTEFSEAKIVASTSKYRVAIQSFTCKPEAIKYMENLRKTDSRFETAWVLCN